MSVKTTVACLPEWGADTQHERPSGVLVDERPSRFAKGRDRGQLYVLAEVSGQEAGRAIVAGQLTRTVRQAYYEWQGSVTAGLLNAVRVANKLLYDSNRDALPGERRTAGISCVVLRSTSTKGQDGGGDLFIAQAGPAAAFILSAGEVTRFPEISPWLDGAPAADLDVVAMGERRDLEVDLFHTHMNGGDTLLLVESAAVQQVPTARWQAILGQGSPPGVLQAMLEAGADGGLAAMVMKLGGADATPAPAPAPAEAESHAPPLPPSPSMWQQLQQWLEEQQFGERLRTTGMSVVAVVASAGAVLLTLARRFIPGQPRPQDTEVTQPTQAKSVKEPQVRAKRQPKTATSARTQHPLVRKALIAIAITIPLLVAAIVVVTYAQRGEPKTNEIENLWQEANSRWQQALQTTDQDAARTILTETDSYLAQILERQPEHTQAADLKKRVNVLLDELNQVRRITWMAELNTYPSDADLARVVVEGVHVFVMDRNAGKVYHHQLDEPQQSLQTETQNAVLVKRGDQVGNVLVGDLVDIAWMPTDFRYRKESLVVLESGGALLQYDPTTEELTALPVHGSEAWSDPRLIGGHTGRFYLLDPAINQIWRYPPTPDGYTEAPMEWLQSSVDLAGVADMAVGDSIYLLYADGRIRKLSTGNPDAFDISDWKTPPSSPSAIFTRPPGDTQWLYVADQGNSRIVQSSKEGEFERQFRLADGPADQGSGLPGGPLGSVTSLFVDEIGGRAYFLSGRKLFLVILPD